MKKILFATTALVATAGVAAADVTVSGAASLGIIKAGAAKTTVESDVDLYFTGSTETDGGVTMTATVEMENLTGTGYTKTNTNLPTQAVGPNTVANQGFTHVISASAGGLTFTWGNTDGALDKSTTELHRIPGIDFELWAAGVDNVDNGQIARLDYKMGDFAVALSWAGQDEATGIGFAYNADVGSAVIALGAGYEKGNLGDAWAISAGSTFGAFSVRANYGDGTEFGKRWGVSAQYAANGLAVGANYFEQAGADNYTVFGTYDLGGGATLFAQTGSRGAAKTQTSSMGVRFSF